MLQVQRDIEDTVHVFQELSPVRELADRQLKSSVLGDKKKKGTGSEQDGVLSMGTSGVPLLGEVRESLMKERRLS